MREQREFPSRWEGLGEGIYSPSDFYIDLKIIR
jgi:hypothetical protein